MKACTHRSVLPIVIIIHMTRIKNPPTILYILGLGIPAWRETIDLGKSKAYLLDLLPVFGGAFSGHDGGFLLFA